MKKIHSVIAKRFNHFPTEKEEERLNLYPGLAKAFQQYQGSFSLFDLFKTVSLIDLRFDTDREDIIEEIQNYFDTSVDVHPLSKSIFGVRYILK